MSEEIRGVRIGAAHLDTRRGRRTLAERIFIRFPGLARVLYSALLRLPIRSRLRRALVLSVAAQASSAVNRRDFESLFTGFDPAFEYRIVDSGGLIAPDQVGTHRGYQGYREVWRRWLESFEDIRLEPEELIDLGDRLISVTRVSGHGSGSGVPISQLIYQVFTFERGLVVDQVDYPDRKQALEAAGLRE